MNAESILAPCAYHPDADGSPHECMAKELRCVYCGIKLAPYGCNGCGQFLSAEELHDGESRCEDCR